VIRSTVVISARHELKFAVGTRAPRVGRGVPSRVILRTRTALPVPSAVGDIEIRPVLPLSQTAIVVSLDPSVVTALLLEVRLLELLEVGVLDLDLVLFG